jgi:RNA polymerase sigma factor (sigma-70 family)
MHASTLRSVLEHLRKLTDPAGVRELSDADLLERFRLGREEAAFTLLVQRHGPMVLAVCRRVLGDAHEAEDAFQATFLVLVRNAAAIRKQESLAGWLHGVAWRIAHKARLRSARQQARPFTTRPSIARDDPSEKLAAAELRAALDEEIERLPDKYRMPLVLCYLADKTHEQAAGELGWPKSSVTARLARARELLQRRLRNRGFTVPAGLLAALLTEQSAHAALPSLLTLATVRLAVQALTGETLTATSASALAGHYVKSMTALKLTATLGLLATLGFAAVGYHRLTVPGSPSPSEPPPKVQGHGEPRARKPMPPKTRVDLFGDPLPDQVIARMGSSRLRHRGYVSTLAFSADGKVIFSGGGNGVRIWDAATGKMRRRFDGASDRSASYAFTANGILVADYDKGKVALQTLDPASGKVRRRLELPDATDRAYLTLSPDGKWLGYSRQNDLRLYDAARGREMFRLAQGGSIAFVPDGKTVAIAARSDTVCLHNIANGECIRRLTHKDDHISSMVASADGRFLASIPYNDGKNPDEMSIWDLHTGEERHRLKAPENHVLSAAFSPDGKYVAVGCQHPHLLLFDLTTGKEVRRFPTDAYFGNIAFSADGKSLAATSGEGIIRLWETATGRVLPASADPYLNSVHELRISGDGRQLLGHAGLHIAWDPDSGRELRRFPNVSLRHWPAALTPDESLLATAEVATIHLWDAKSGQEVRTWKAGDKFIYRLIVSPDGHRLISSDEDGIIRVWDVADGKEIRKLTCGNRMMRLAMSPDGHWLASASDKRGAGGYEVILWDLASGREKAHFAMLQNSSAHHLAFSPNSRLLAAVGGGRLHNDPGEVQVWDVTGAEPRRSLEGHKGRVASVAFSPDNRTLATGDQTGELLLWELSSGRRRHHFVGHESWITSLAFSTDGRKLAAASFDAPVFVWDVLGTIEQVHRSMSQLEMQHCWKALAGDDASAAFQAIRRLAAVPEQTLPFLREHLKPVPAPDQKRIRQLVEMLDSADFPTRQKAVEELEKQNDAAAGLLRQIVAKEKPSLEVRRRLQQIVESIDNKPESLRAVRAVEVLEWIATPDAVRFLNELAGGAADARLTREASAAKRRLRR